MFSVLSQLGDPNDHLALIGQVAGWTRQYHAATATKTLGNVLRCWAWAEVETDPVRTDSFLYWDRQKALLPAMISSCRNLRHNYRAYSRDFWSVITCHDYLMQAFHQLSYSEFNVLVMGSGPLRYQKDLFQHPRLRLYLCDANFLFLRDAWLKHRAHIGGLWHGDMATSEHPLLHNGVQYHTAFLDLSLGYLPQLRVGPFLANIRRRCSWIIVRETIFAPDDEAHQLMDATVRGCYQKRSDEFYEGIFEQHGLHKHYKCTYDVPSYRDSSSTAFHDHQVVYILADYEPPAEVVELWPQGDALQFERSDSVISSDTDDASEGDLVNLMASVNPPPDVDSEPASADQHSPTGQMPETSFQLTQSV